MVETRAELPFTGDQVGLSRAQPGRSRAPPVTTGTPGMGENGARGVSGPGVERTRR
jgi:hypothetical protein